METPHLTTIFLFFLSFNQLSAQAYDDYIGAGHDRDITVMSSSNWQQTGWSQTASADKTINGDGLEGKLSEAARFLSHAAISHDMEEIEYVAEIGIENWIEEQIEQPYSLYLPMIKSVVADHQAYQLANDITPLWGAVTQLQTTTMWRMNMEERDFLRDKIALSWAELIVISRNSDLSPYGYGLMDFLDIYKRNAFGNFYDILREITLHPAMGIYLSHYSNPKANPDENTLPDENFAREVMQLFTIGLHVLNNDGTEKLTPDGDLIPTYDNVDIGELAKVFTGLGASATADPSGTPFFGLGFWGIDYTQPMMMYEPYHETAEKVLFDGNLIIPANQTGIEDIDMALTYLFNHPNTPPFICKRLIQLMIKSNPTPEYVERVSNVFIADDTGVRGNMEAVFKAILLDEEARTCEWQQHPSNGRLKHASEKSFQFARVVDIESESGEVWTDSKYQVDATGHVLLSAPSVFNFHSPTYVPQGEISDAGMVAPEFQMLTTYSSVGFGNQTWRWFYLWEEYGAGSWRDESHIMKPNLEAYLEAQQDPEVLINEMDMRLTNGNMTAYTRQLIKDFVTDLDVSTSNWPLSDTNEIEKIKQVLILLFLSPDYNITK